MSKKAAKQIETVETLSSAVKDNTQLANAVDKAYAEASDNNAPDWGDTSREDALASLRDNFRAMHDVGAQQNVTLFAFAAVNAECIFHALWTDPKFRETVKISEDMAADMVKLGHPTPAMFRKAIEIEVIEKLNFDDAEQAMSKSSLNRHTNALYKFCKIRMFPTTAKKVGLTFGLHWFEKHSSGSGYMKSAIKVGDTYPDQNSDAPSDTATLCPSVPINQEMPELKKGVPNTQTTPVLLTASSCLALDKTTAGTQSGDTDTQTSKHDLNNWMSDVRKIGTHGTFEALHQMVADKSIQSTDKPMAFNVARKVLENTKDVSRQSPQFRTALAELQNEVSNQSGLKGTIEAAAEQVKKLRKVNLTKMDLSTIEVVADLQVELAALVRTLDTGIIQVQKPDQGGWINHPKSS